MKKEQIKTPPEEPEESDYWDTVIMIASKQYAAAIKYDITYSDLLSLVFQTLDNDISCQIDIP